jgi:hypothetical protein
MVKGLDRAEALAVEVRPDGSAPARSGERAPGGNEGNAGGSGQAGGDQAGAA